MKNYLLISQIIVSAILITLALLQNRGTALGSSFGGEGGSFYSTRRGFQKKLLWGTIIFGAIFIVLAAMNLVVS
jgi:protein translocase SecG subunit